MAKDRTSFAPKTTSSNLNKPDRNRTESSKINEPDRYSAAHNGLVACSSPAGPTKEAFDLSFQIGFSRTWEDLRWSHTRRKFYEVAEAIGSTWRWSGLLLFKQTGLLFVRSTDSSSLRARSRDGRPRKLLWAIQQHRLMGLRHFCSGNELPQLAQARRADLQ
jgi:hypothetical protein